MSSEPKAAIVKLDGTIIRTDGTQLKSNYFKFLELHPDDYSDIEYTPEQAKRIKGRLLHLSTGSAAAIPMVCGGAAKCPFADRCMYIQEDKLAKLTDPSAKPITPVGRSCLIEVNLLNQWTMWYINEYDVQEGAWTDIQFCRELAEIELMRWRLNNNLAKPENASLVQDTIVGTDKEGNPLTRKEENAFFVAKDRLDQRKGRVIKLLVGDRQEKYKREAALKQKSEDDTSSRSAQLRTELMRLLEFAGQRVITVHNEPKTLPPAPSSTEGLMAPDSLIDDLIDDDDASNEE
jgi:hypothetical protein